MSYNMYVMIEHHDGNDDWEEVQLYKIGEYDSLEELEHAIGRSSNIGNYPMSVQDVLRSIRHYAKEIERERSQNP